MTMVPMGGLPVPMGGVPALVQQLLQQQGARGMLGVGQTPLALGSGVRALGSGMPALGPGVGLEGAPFSLARNFAGGAGAGGAGAVAGDVAGAAGSAGLLARLGAVPGALAEVGPRAVLGRAGLGALAGTIGSTAVDKLYPGSNSAGEQTLQGAALGAGVGASVGSIVPVLGTGLGALVGGGVGGATGLLTSLLGKKKTGPENFDAVLSRVIDAGAISPTAAEQIGQRYSALIALDPSSKGKETARAAAMQLLQAEVLNPSSSPTAPTPPTAWTPEQMMAMQLQTAQFLKPYSDQAQSNAAQARDLTNQLAGDMDPRFASVLKAGAAQTYSATSNLANAYAAQAAMSPQNAAFQQQQQYQQQVASQQAQMAISNLLSGKTGGANDLTALLGQLGAGAGAPQ